jgi:hypothetical protein
MRPRFSFIPGGGMSAIPSHAELTESLGRTFILGTASGHEVQARLVSAPAGIPMDDSFVCYSALFELPPGVQLPQDVYQVQSPDGPSWSLLATPVRPSESGSAMLCAVMHCVKPALSPSTDAP